MKIKFLEKKNKFVKGDSKIKPDTYWQYILIFTFFLFVVSFAFGFYLFLQTSKDINVFSSNANEQDFLKKEKFNSVLEYFKEREKKSEEILNSPSPVVDPSL